MSNAETVVRQYKAMQNGNASQLRIVQTQYGYEIRVLDDVTTADWGVYGIEPVYAYISDGRYGYKAYKTIAGAERRIKTVLSFSMEWKLEQETQGVEA